MSSLSNITNDEYIATLKHSSLATIIVEGINDIHYLRQIEKVIPGISILPVGGKSRVLDLRKRIGEFGNIRTAFLIDKDSWVIDGVPFEIQSDPLIVTTDGYSIENDILRDSNIVANLTALEETEYCNDINRICHWFCAAILEKKANPEFTFEVPVSRILCKENGHTEEAKSIISQHTPDAIFIESMVTDHQKKLRGKTWQKLLTHYLDCNNRTPKIVVSAVMAHSMSQGGRFVTSLFTSIQKALDESKNIANAVLP
jgi:Protein of unknown function (DUF4435)